MQIHKPGNYNRGTFKLTIILAVETGDLDIVDGDIGLESSPPVWAYVTTEPGTFAIAYCAFVEHVLNTYNTIENLALCRTLIHHNHNLTSHRAPEVYKAVRKRGHHVVCHPPYRPQDGPVEHVINQVWGCLVKRWSEIRDLETMKTIIKEIIDNNINSMDKTFVH